MAKSTLSVIVALLSLSQVYGYGWTQYQQPGYDVQIDLPPGYQVQVVEFDNIDAEAVAEKASADLNASYTAACEEIQEAQEESVAASQAAIQQLEKLAGQVQQSVCTLNLQEIQNLLYYAQDPEEFQSCATEIINAGVQTAQAYVDTAYQCIVDADTARQQATDFATQQTQEIYETAKQHCDYYCQMLSACAYNPYGQCDMQYQSIQTLVEEQATVFNGVLTPLSAADDTHYNAINACLAVAYEAQRCLRDDIVQQAQAC